jgi:hypothetical protein
VSHISSTLKMEFIRFSKNITRCHNPNKEIDNFTSLKSLISHESINYSRTEVLKAVKLSMLIYCFVTPCGLEGSYQRFEGKHGFHFQGLSISPLRSEILCSSETLIGLCIFKFTRHYNSEEQYGHYLFKFIVVCLVLMKINTFGTVIFKHRSRKCHL